MPVIGQRAFDDPAKPGVGMDDSVPTYGDRRMDLRRAGLQKQDIARAAWFAHLDQARRRQCLVRKDEAPSLGAVIRWQRESDLRRSEAGQHQPDTVEPGRWITPLQAERYAD
ncbi:hypothetical protein WG75_12910 [Citromicrobium sp. WPS32]|nr:hypothetical protein WG75_12910 [Citromicrobium sp. WPS32]